MESEVSLLYTKELATSPYSEPHESSPHTNDIYIKIQFILSSLLSLGFPSGLFPLSFPIRIQTGR
jgi:hypothetical protein